MPEDRARDVFPFTHERYLRHTTVKAQWKKQAEIRPASPEHLIDEGWQKDTVMFVAITDMHERRKEAEHVS